VIPHGPLAEVGFNGPMLIILLVFWLGLLAVVAAIPAAIAVAIFGPRRPGAVIVPAAATFLVVVAIFLVARWTMADALKLVLIATFTAFAAARIQLVVSQRVGGDIVIPGRVWAVGGSVVGVGLGAIAGGVAAALTNSASLIALFALMGLIVGAIRGAVHGRARVDSDRSRAAPGP
jgi:hypothetical protein